MLPKPLQDESRSISENSTWGIRRKYEQGKVSVNYTKFLGYDKGENGNLAINEKQAKIVRRIFKEYLDGKGTNRIARELEEGGVPNWNGKAKWYEGSIRKMLSNEKYKGDALLQKTYTVDFLTKKRVVRTNIYVKIIIATSETILHIDVTSKSSSDVIDKYKFNTQQVGMLNELMQDKYQQLFIRFTSSYVDSHPG